MGQVAAFVAHEINTPLTNIALLSASIARAVQDPVVLEKLQKLDRQRRLAGTIVTELLSLSRSHELRRIPVDVRSVVASAIEQIIELKKADVKLVEEIPRNPIVASVDPLRLQQALINLLKNAFEATTLGSVTIAVIDTGSGMDAETRARLFQPFVTTKPRLEGLGLGLVFTKQVVESHDGSIAVFSDPGIGSTFTITLPKGTTDTPKAPAVSTAPETLPKAP